MLGKYSAETAQVATSTTSLQVQHIHFGLVSCWDDKSTVTRSWSLALRKVKNLTGLRCIIRHVGWCATPVAPADVADNLGVLDSFNGTVESLDRPIFKTIGPGKLVELNEIHSERIYFENVLVDGFGNVHCPVTAGLIVYVVGSLGKHLNARVLDLDRFVRGFFERFGLLHHDRPSPLDLLG